MKIGVLCGTLGWHFQDLVRAAQIHRFEITPLSYTQLAAEITGSDSTSQLTGRHAKHSRTEWLRSVDVLLIRAMPMGSLEQVVFRMDLLGQLEKQFSVPIINPPRTIECAVNKYLCLESIRGGVVQVPETRVTEDLDTAIEHFKLFQCDVVTKPILFTSH